jgi:hypothetical protein
MQEALEAAFLELLFGPPLDGTDTAGIEAWLARSGLPEAHARAIRESEIEGLLVYRRLVRGTLRDALEAAIPRSMARLGTLFDEYFDGFLAEKGPRTHYLRDVTTEFLEFCELPWKRDPRVPAYAYDLARHEALHIQIAAMPLRAAHTRDGELDLEAGLEFSEASRLVRYEYAVHRLSESVEDRSAPERKPTSLFVYRSPEHSVRYLELTVLAAGLLDRLLRGASLKDALLGASTELGVTLDAGVLSGAAQLLSDLAERGALIGPRAIEASAAAPQAAPKLPAVSRKPHENSG